MAIENPAGVILSGTFAVTDPENVD